MASLAEYFAQALCETGLSPCNGGGLSAAVASNTNHIARIVNVLYGMNQAMKSDGYDAILGTTCCNLTGPP